MKISYDPKVDAVYIEFRSLEPGTADNRQLSDDVIANYGPDGKLAGLEILDASKVLGQGEADRALVFQIEPMAAAASASDPKL